MTPQHDAGRYLVRRFFGDGNDDPSYTVMQYLDDAGVWVDVATTTEPWTAMDLCDQLNAAERLADDITRLEDALSLAWSLVASVGDGDWTTHSPDWQVRAAQWRDVAFPLAPSLPPNGAVGDD